MTQELEAMTAAPTSVEIAGETLYVRPIKVKQLPEFVRAVQPIFAELESGDVAAALMANVDHVIDAVVVASGQPRAWVEGLEVDQLVDLAGVCIQVNGDFFVHRLAPSIERASGRLSELTSGLPSPSASSQTGTGTPT